MGFSSWFAHDPADAQGQCLTDTDIAGIGVVISFVAASIFTTGTAIYAAYLDGVTNAPRGVLPARVTYWLSADQSTEMRQKYLFRRAVLDRFMLALADQQLLTGFSLLATAAIKMHISPWLHSPDTTGEHMLYDTLGAHFSLVVYLCCLCSSSHLACMITLNEYFAKDKKQRWLRVSLVIIFAVLLTISIMISISFKLLLYPLEQTLEIAFGVERQQNPHTFVKYLAVLAVVVAPLVLYPFWISIFQLSHNAQSMLRALLRHWLVTPLCLGLRKISRWKWLHKVSLCVNHKEGRKRVRAILLFLLFGNMGVVFCLQILFVTVSLLHALGQKFTSGWVDSDGVIHCSLNQRVENAMGFGQILPLFLLLLPALSAFELYCDLQNETAQERAQ